MPIAVQSACGFTHISAGYRHSAGIGCGHIPLLWGVNDNGQLGTGRFTDELLPTPPSGCMAGNLVQVQGQTVLSIRTGVQAEE